MRFREQPSALVFSLVALALALLAGVVIPLGSGLGSGPVDLSWTPPPTATATLRAQLGQLTRASTRPATAVPTVTHAPSATPTIAVAATIAIAATAAATPGASPSPIATPGTPTLVPTRDALARIPEGPVNLRAGPGPTYAVLATAKSGAEFEVRGRSEDGRWVQLCCVLDVPAWASVEFVELATALDAFPIVP